MNNNFLSKVPSYWLSSKGKGVRIGVCDTSCNVKHKALQHAIRDYRKFGEEMVTNHSTHVVGIIAAKPEKEEYNFGLCVDADLYVASFSAFDSCGHSSLLKSLEWMLELDIDVLNLSFAYLHEDKRIREILQEISKKTLIFSAYSMFLKYPNSFDCVISVGTENDENAELRTKGAFVSTTRNGCYNELKGASMATAFASSVGGLAKAQDKNMNKEKFLLNVCGNELLLLQKEKNIVKPGSNQINLTF